MSALAKRTVEPIAAPSIAEQVAAIEACLEIARGVERNILGKTPGFVELRAVYAKRIAGLEAAIATLRAVPKDAA